MSRFGGIDPLEPLAALGIEGVMSVEPVSGGMDTLIWRVDTRDGVYALRLFRPNQGDQCANEVRAMRTVGALGVPVPRIATHGTWGERPAILMEWCDGRPILDVALAHPELSEPLGRSMGRLHARLHAVHLPREDWDDHRTWLGWCGPGEEDLRRLLRTSGLRDGHLLHLDFHPRNVLCVGEAATVILDWANVAVGDPRADVARTRSIFQFVSPPPAAGPAYSTVRARLEQAWMEGYTQLAGQLAEVELFDIWAGIVFLQDMEQHRGRPDFWMEPADFDRVRAVVASLKRRTGLSRES